MISMDETRWNDTHWISTAAALPADGQSVEFILGARECPIVGVYTQDAFRSRWTRYAADVVCKWRGATAGDLSLRAPH